MADRKKTSGKNGAKNPRHQSEELFHLRIKILVLSVREIFVVVLITRAWILHPSDLDRQRLVG